MNPGYFIIQVFTRYVLNAPLGWTTEMCLIAYLWFAFWGGGLMTRERDQVRFDLIYQHVAPPVRRVLAILVAVIIGSVFLFALPANLDFITFMAHDKTWVMEIRFDYVFSVFIVFVTAMSIRSFWRAYRLIQPNWEKEI